MNYKSNCNCVANNLTYALRTTETIIYQRLIATYNLFAQ